MQVARELIISVTPLVQHSPKVTSALQILDSVSAMTLSTPATCQTSVVNEIKVAELTRCTPLGLLLKRIRQRLVIRVDCERPRFQHTLKMFNSEINS